eukprot:COSAG01_NODE_1344_length_10638_cov_4.525856_7_plen_133_part_00
MAAAAAAARDASLPSMAYSLVARTWTKSPAGAVAPWNPPPPVTHASLQSVSVKGRSSHEEKEAWAKGAQLLLGPRAWQIQSSTEFAEVEQMVVVLVVRFCPSIATSITVELDDDDDDDNDDYDDCIHARTYQ